MAAGERAVHEAGTKYLPELADQDSDEYNAYRDRAGFYGATARTIEALCGLLFRKHPAADLPAGMDTVTENIDGQGSGLLEFAAEVAREVVTVGRVGILADHPPRPDTENVITISEQATLGQFPFLARYDAESILDYRTEMRGARRTVALVRLSEGVEAEPDSEDEFATETVAQIRVLDLDAAGFYRVRLYREDDGGEWLQHGDDMRPLRNGAPMREIPFVFVGATDTKPEIGRAPLIDLANVNVSHYRSSADYEHGLHFVALPTPVITGHQDDENDSYNIGAAAAWVLREAEAKAFYLEFSGSGLGQLNTAIKDKESRMAAIGARLLAPEKRAAEAADTLSIRAAGENAALINISSAVSAGMTRALVILAEWMGRPTDSIAYELNDDFNPAGMDPQMLTALLGAWQSGAISMQTLFARLQDGEIVDAEKDFEDELDEIAELGPPAVAEPGPMDDAEDG